MMRAGIRVLCLLVLGGVACQAQELSPKWEDLTAPDFVKAIHKAEGVCLLPMGSIEKSGPAEPLGTNLYVIRALTLDAVKREYAVVFPEYFVAGTNDVSNLPGAVAYPSETQHQFLKETLGEMSRNGCKKILIVNGHSGNNGMLTDILMTSFTEHRDYVLYMIQGGPPKVTAESMRMFGNKLPAEAMPSKPDADGHGGEERTSVMMYYYPEITHPERGHDEPSNVSVDLKLPRNMTVSVKRMAETANGYLGDASGATVKRGKALSAYVIDSIVESIQAVKADKLSLKLQDDFYQQQKNPLR